VTLAADVVETQLADIELDVMKVRLLLAHRRAPSLAADVSTPTGGSGAGATEAGVLTAKANGARTG
jgi:hypothetical protein